MDWIDPRSPLALKAALAQAGARPRKRWGQHFLVDRNIFMRMVSVLAAAHPPERGPVLEVGAGPGGLTVSLLEAGYQVWAVEIDPLWEPGLLALKRRFPRALTVVMGDALHLSWADLGAAGPDAPWAVTGNLPYYATAPLLAKLWEDALYWDQAVLMVQREAAARLTAAPGSRETTALSVELHLIGIPREVATVSRRLFYPPPAVDSAIFSIRRRPGPPPVPMETARRVLAAAFGARRKTLARALGDRRVAGWDHETWAARLQALAIDPGRRAERLELGEWERVIGLVAAAPAPSP
ncbi:Ribosomal RNA small subunit methyltransferase A [Candidatus Hydrogenisulfobacillus filiaventi]|uniref:rRNA adenine N-6-methyltransferase n=1 Tax=Candidatus Hydrogenisulfobacillus filiaventi TaxID=2707344 RepID=A0A6F8ZK66_9FIRM|nr:Ribosomal RNA small subunit methyltransferase A [Candidatus Hydrogenisulfobacillus filiaventi]